MFSYIWHTLFFDPVYNTLVFFIDIFPGGDVGLAIIATVVVVKLALFKVSIKAVRTQKVLRDIEPKLREIKEQHKDDREAYARAMMELYKKSGINPFASILVMFIQIPFIIALYFAVMSGGGVPLPDINTALLYRFIPSPDTVSMMMFSVFDITAKSLPLALIAGFGQYIHTYYAMPPLPPREADAAPNFKDDLMRNMNLQMRYVMPLIIVVVAYTLSAAIAIYFIVTSVMSLIQELVVRKHR
jgi:YidC/Oxa1 family membrane protein insertase